LWASSSSSEKQATGPGLLKDSPISFVFKETNCRCLHV
jgi:hypothetical protein